MTNEQQTRLEADFVSGVDHAYSRAERLNNRASHRLPTPDQIRALIKYEGLVAAMRRWGHLYTSSAILHLSCGSQSGGGYDAGWSRRRARQQSEAG